MANIVSNGELNWSLVKTATSQNGDRNGYIQNGNKPKQHVQF